ncbi:PilN domain-containing protein [Rugamonas sp.]|uniref:PilN domain-containing protein n=1 Tax=Rugamonas sp. TaxID=1926287 RepID=UPI0025DBE493|nr:PilN domain-containing protein [Rugamonas sp.]
MKSLRIDFAARTWRRALFHLHPLVLTAGAAGLLLCAGAALGGWQLLQQQRAREHQLQHQRERLATRLAAPATAIAAPIPAPQAAFVNAAIMQLNLPWRDLQDAVAAATPPNVALLALEPDARKQLLKLSAEARNADDMVAYIEQLKQQELFSSVVLTRHEINEQDPNRPLRFDLEAVWVGR